ncbi:MAG: hypothetical protein RR767_13470 [Acinetobacter sp.]
MKIALLGLVIVSVIGLLALLWMSFKLLSKAQKEELAERREMRKSGRSQAGQQQVHPQVAEEHKRLEKLKKELENKK